MQVVVQSVLIDYAHDLVFDVVPRVVTWYAYVNRNVEYLYLVLKCVIICLVDGLLIDIVIVWLRYDPFVFTYVQRESQIAVFPMHCHVIYTYYLLANVGCLPLRRVIEVHSVKIINSEAVELGAW